MQKPAILGGPPAFANLLPFANPGFPPSPALLEKMKKVMESGILSKGPYAEEFESRCAQFLGVSHAIAVSSCSSGLCLSLQALDLSGEVIVPAFTFPAAPGSIVQCGLTPVFANCHPHTFNIDPHHVERLITPKTSAIMAVSNYGLPPDIHALEKIAEMHGLKLICDSAQAFGATYKGTMVGNFGSVEVFSLSQSKIFTTGEGGLVTTDIDSLAEKIRQGRNYGKSESGEFLYAGHSARLSELHALMGLELLVSVPDFLQKRKALAKLYREQLTTMGGVEFQTAGEGMESSESYFPIFIDGEKFGLHRDEVWKALTKENIETRKFFSPPAYQHTAFVKFKREDLPATEKASEECLALPLYPNLEHEEVDKICDAMERIYRWRKDLTPHLKHC